MREKYESLALVQLKELAKVRGLKGTSTMKKADLVEAMLAEDERLKKEEEAKAAEEKQEAAKSFHKKNGGPSSARNFGLQQAGGEYVGFVDSDDYVDADMYERLYGAIEKTGMPVAQVGRDEIDKDGNILPNICEPVATEQVIPAEDFLKELLMHRGDCSFCTKLLRKDLFTIEQFPVGALNEDFHLLVKMLTREESAVPGIACIPGQAYHVFYRPDSNTRDKNRFSRVFADNIDNADMVLALVDKKYPELSEIAFRFGIFQRLDYLLHIPVGRMVDTDVFYKSVKQYLRGHFSDTRKNPLLDKKSRTYLTILTIAPKTVRRVHGWTMKLRGVG